MKQYIRKADIILFIVLVLTGLAASAALSLSHSDAGADARVIIESGGDLYARYPLSEDRTVVVPAPKQISSDSSAADKDASPSDQYDYYNVVEISGGTVSVTEASCKNQVCVKHGAISGTGESIVCLPNRLVVRIESGGSGEGGSYDSVTS
ncbi:MAG: NusG domain II-containing protein [Mogibacterium sp.]|nr:NusG domain II-containing protein [Mogibacterium sp.]